jgi:hypothetical protein
VETSVTIERIISLTHYIKVQHKKDKLKRYLDDIHQCIKNISVKKRSMPTSTQLKQVITKECGEDNENIHMIADSDNELKVIKGPRLVVIDTGEHTVRLLTQETNIEVQSSQYNCELECVATVLEYISYKPCRIGSSKSCQRLSPALRGDRCCACRDVNRKRKRKEEHATEGKVLERIDVVSPAFGQHARNQLERVNNPLKPYNKK